MNSTTSAFPVPAATPPLLSLPDFTRRRSPNTAAWVMQRLALVITALVISLAVSAALAQESPALKVVKVEIVPNSVKDRDDAFFRGRPILEVAPRLEKEPERLRLPTYRSYRFIVTVRIGMDNPPSSFAVETQCLRDGKTVTLGKTRVAVDGRSNQYACYDVFPAEAGPGDCVIRTVIEAHDDKAALDFGAAIVR